MFGSPASALGAFELSHGALGCFQRFIKPRSAVQRRVPPACKASEIIFVLIGDVLPRVLRENATWSLPAIVLSLRRNFFNSAQMSRQIRRIVTKHDAAIANHFTIEWIVQSQYAIAVSEGLQHRRIRSAHAVTVYVRKAVAMELLDVLTVIDMPQK